MAELYFCSNCNKLNELNQHGRCSKCDSDAVLSVEKIQAALDGPKPRILSIAMDDELGWLFEYNGFECFVSFAEADDVNEAVNIAQSGSHPWYIREKVSGRGSDDINGRVIKRNEWCDWVRS